MLTPHNRLSRLIAVIGVIAGITGSSAFAQEMKPADPGAMQPPAVSADTAPTPPEASPAPVAPTANSADTTAAQPAEPTLAKALAAYEKQDFTSAVEALQQAVGADPSAVEAHYYLGYALYKLKRFDEARVAFAQVYQLQSTYLPPAAKSK